MAPTIEVKDEVEGEHVETSDFFFDRIGEPVPVRPTGGGGGGPELYDPGSLPSQPLAVSERFRLVFVAHSSGFCVARTGDVVEAAKEMKEKGSRSSLLELSVSDVPRGWSTCSGFLPILRHLRLLLGELSTSSQSIRFSISGFSQVGSSRLHRSRVLSTYLRWRGGKLSFASDQDKRWLLLRQYCSPFVMFSLELWMILFLQDVGYICSSAIWNNASLQLQLTEIKCGPAHYSVQLVTW